MTINATPQGMIYPTRRTSGAIRGIKRLIDRFTHQYHAFGMITVFVTYQDGIKISEIKGEFLQPQPSMLTVKTAIYKNSSLTTLNNSGVSFTTTA
jgi:hypothetical protein